MEQIDELQAIVAGLESDMLKLMTGMGQLLSEVKRLSTNSETAAKAIYALGANDKDLGASINQILEAIGTPTGKIEPKVLN